MNPVNQYQFRQTISMTILRICLHSLILTLANIASILIGFGLYHSLKPVNQIAVQIPAAVMLSIIAFVTWGLIIHHLPFQRLFWENSRELAWVYLAALLWGPLIFVPFHYVTQGYLTAFGNILPTWLFQLPVNLLAVLAARRLIDPQEGNKVLLPSAKGDLR